jgi:putative ABC transport system permease protein
MVENEITKEYVDYVKAMPKEYYNALTLGYGLDFTRTIFTDFSEFKGQPSRHVSVKQLTDIYKSVLSDTEYKDLASMIDRLAPNFSQAPDNNDYILSQYNLVGDSKLATEKDEIMLVLDSNDELTDLLLARLGYYSQDEFMEIIHKADNTDDEGNSTYNESLYRQYFSYDELLGKTLTWYPTDSLFSTTEVTVTVPSLIPGQAPSTTVTTAPVYTGEMESASSEGMTLKVVGILTPKDNISYGVMSSGIYYTKALTDYTLEVNKNSEFVDYLIGDEEKADDYITSFTYSYEYMPYSAFDGEDAIKERSTNEKGTVFSYNTRESIARTLGGLDLANSIKIYPISFEDKSLVTQYLDEWNETHDKITYTDSLELIIAMLTTMIDIISYALIAFTSISLVVSTVMIGIITYVSVVERIKEIGVIRSLGGSKRDVSNLFIAETAIIGFLAGTIGIAVTYLISAVVNVILTPLIGFSGIASLPIGNAIFLVCLSIGLTLISGLAPAKSAANKDPVVALRTE